MVSVKQWCIRVVVLLGMSLCAAFPAAAAVNVAWMDGNSQAIWQKSPGFYKEGSTWYVIFHAKASVEEVRLVGDFAPTVAAGIPLSRTPDGQFWWFKGTDANFAILPKHGDKYRFAQLEAGVWTQVQDPAARWVETSELTKSSRLYLTTNYAWQSNSWQRPAWSSYNVYQVHPLRFTSRNVATPALTPFQQVTEELDGDGVNDYILNTGASALQLLPVNEFAGDLSWGYNPSFFYAIENSYGGPDQLKKLVDTAHQKGKAVVLDLVYNHVGTGDNILWQVNSATYIDGDTVWGGLLNFDNPVAQHFLIQNLIYLAKEYRIDGFRFDHTNTIHNPDSGFVRVKGSGGGLSFLREMRRQIKAVDPKIVLIAEELPNWWPLSDDNMGSAWQGDFHGPMDSQWTDNFHDNFKAVLTGAHLNLLNNVFNNFTVNWYNASIYSESHDEVGNTDDRIAKRGRDGKGWEMNQISLAGTIMGRGMPMVFMGQEAGETRQFHIDWWADCLNLADYEANAGRAKILAWYKALNAIRNADKTILSESNSVVRYIHDIDGVFAFARGNNDYLIVMNFRGATRTNYNIGISGYYREVANTSWPEFNLGGVPEASRGKAAQQITTVSVPAYGAVILKKETPPAPTTVSITFQCNNGITYWGQNVYVVGDLPELGAWNVTNAKLLGATAYPAWTGSFTLPVNKPVQWKCIKKDGANVVWQGGNNNSFTTPASGTATVQASF